VGAAPRLCAACRVPGEVAPSPSGASAVAVRPPPQVNGPAFPVVKLLPPAMLWWASGLGLMRIPPAACHISWHGQRRGRPLHGRPPPLPPCHRAGDPEGKAGGGIGLLLAAVPIRPGWSRIMTLPLCANPKLRMLAQLLQGLTWARHVWNHDVHDGDISVLHRQARAAATPLGPLVAGRGGGAPGAQPGLGPAAGPLWQGGPCLLPSLQPALAQPSWSAARHGPPLPTRPCRSLPAPMVMPAGRPTPAPPPPTPHPPTRPPAPLFPAAGALRAAAQRPRLAARLLPAQPV
jgi:hypothetical protein